MNIIDKLKLNKVLITLTLSLIPLQLSYISVTNTDTFKDKLVQEIKRDEGFMARAYRDSLGFWTIGYGRYLASYTSKTVSEPQAHYMLLEDMDKHTAVIDKKIPWVHSLDEARKAALLNMSFQMGAYKLLQFKTVLAKVREGDYSAASSAMLQSRWAKQTPKRAQRLAKQMETGIWA